MRSRRRRRVIIRRLIIGTAAIMVLVVGGVAAYGAYLYHDINQVRRSAVLKGTPAKTKAGTNLLVMGLDSRVDENGNPLPKKIYEALHTGDQSVGGLNSNVLMLIHISGDGKHAVGISIPRDDYVAFPGCPDGECHGKIKEAYGLAADQKQRELSAKGVTGQAAYQQSRDAGRAAEIKTVDQFLGVHISSFIEVTMVAFYQFAQVVQPIKVCVKENTVDTFSGADFHKGVQEISASQALAFVRQRRDTHNPSLNFTDLDRERRQQAFIISLLTQLKSADTLLDPTKTLGLMDVAKKNIVLSQNLNTLALVGIAEHLAGGGLHFYTMPIQSFGVVDGQDVNLVDAARVRATAAQLLSGKPAPKHHAAPADPPPPVADYTVSVTNASGIAGAAAAQESSLTGKGYRAGTIGNGPTQSATVVKYNPADKAAAHALARTVGAGTTIAADPSLAAGQLVVVLGTAPLGGPTSVPTAVSGTGGGRSGPPVTALTDINSGGVPCVK
ncbi:LytR family transcriptional regulator [Flexivirga caeni]|uniref:LytR family transcriptional regulator n=2 Tax=Flexivirga caeni TaxID=2294115 RepID=A0A3M9M9T5_9MICO|nr:LytR family transcriptional regulator [Flexivirga caeni]